jgi:enoyl-CoA hydratase
MLKIEILDNEILLLTLSKEEALNSMCEEMARQFRELRARMITEEFAKIRGVILTGAGDYFSSGGDKVMLREKTKLSLEENRVGMVEYYRSFLWLTELNIPTVCALNGPAIGAAAGVAIACTYRIAVDEAYLSFPFMRIGLHPGMGTSTLLKAVVGESRALELFLTGRKVSAKEALTLNLIHQVASKELLLETSVNFLRETFLLDEAVITQLMETFRKDSPITSSSLLNEAYNQSLNFRALREKVKAT